MLKRKRRISPLSEATSYIVSREDKPGCFQKFINDHKGKDDIEITKTCWLKNALQAFFKKNSQHLEGSWIWMKPPISFNVNNNWHVYILCIWYVVASTLSWCQIWSFFLLVHAILDLIQAVLPTPGKTKIKIVYNKCLCSYRKRSVCIRAHWSRCFYPWVQGWITVCPRLSKKKVLKDWKHLPFRIWVARSSLVVSMKLFLSICCVHTTSWDQDYGVCWRLFYFHKLPCSS